MPLSGDLRSSGVRAAEGHNDKDQTAGGFSDCHGLTIAWLAFGVAVAGVSFFLRYHATFAMGTHGAESMRFKFLRGVMIASWYVSLAAFVIGLLWVVLGAWDLLAAKS